MAHTHFELRIRLPGCFTLMHTTRHQKILLFLDMLITDKIRQNKTMYITCTKRVLLPKLFAVFSYHCK